MAPRQPTTLELDEDLRYHHLERRAARLTWIGLLVLMAATLLGVFGQGPLSEAVAGEPGGPLLVEYARFARYGASMRITVHVQPDAGGRSRVGLSRSLVEAFRVTQITPAPAATELAADGVDYTFDATSPGAPVIFEIQPAVRWFVRGTVRTSGRDVRLTQFVYP